MKIQQNLPIPLPASFGGTGLNALGTGIAVAIAINIGTAGSVVVQNGALGTPSSGVGTNITGVNAATLGGATFVSPGAIGTTTPAAIKGTTIWQSSRNAFTHFGQQNPTGSSSASGVMMGLGSTWALTPSFSGRVRVEVGGFTASSAAGVNNIELYYGTGVAPANGAAITGTIANIGFNCQNASNANHFGILFEVTGLTLSTAYWFDIGLVSTSGTGTIKPTMVVIQEF